MQKIKGTFLFFLLSTLLASMTSCGTLIVGFDTTPTPNLRMTQTVSVLATGNAALATLIAQPTSTPRPTQISTPQPGITLEPTEAAGQFSNLRFATLPDPAEARRFFVAGTPRIYAIWDYRDMKPGMTIVRTWYLNGEIWLNKTELWNYTKYGSSGTVTDVSVFDENVGLQAGEYSLTLFIDGKVQKVGEGSSAQDQGSFWLFEPDVRSSVVSPDKNYTAMVSQGSKLIIEEANGRQHEMVNAQEIASLDWFPDSQHLLYTERDRSRQTSPLEDWGITHKMWILDVVTGERHLIGAPGEDFHYPRISPTGRYIAVLSGATYGDGCTSSPTLAIIGLDGELRRQSVYRLRDFAGLPYLNPGNANVYPSDHTRPGRWESDEQFVTGLFWTCLTSGSDPGGLYLLDLSQMKAEKIGGM